MLYFRAFVGKDEIGTDDPRAYRRGDRAGAYVATRADGSPYTFISNFNAPAALIDFTDPEAVRWWQRRVISALELGAEGFMQDFGEQVQADMHFARRHDRLDDAQPAADALPPGDGGGGAPLRALATPVARSSTSPAPATPGRPGSARYEFANFPGDETTDWSSSSGIASLTPDMLNRASAAPTASPPTSAATSTSALQRDHEGAVHPLGPVGGALADVPRPRLGRSPASTCRGPTTRRPCSVYKRSRACTAAPVPLIMRLWKRAKRTGIPITRPLWLAYPRDERAARAGPAVDARAERAGGPGGRGGRDLARGLLPARLLARAEVASATAAGRAPRSRRR